MFEATRARARWPWLLGATALIAGAAALGWTQPSLVERFGVLAGGGNPLAEPIASARHDQRYPESPLAVSLALEAGLVGSEPHDPAGVLAFADDLARDVGFWLLAHTGAHDIDAAEEALWTSPREPDALAVAWAVRLQQRNVYARDTQRLSAGIPAEGYRYAHPDELALLLLHVAWRLDLGMDLVRSPIHRYVAWREPLREGRAGERVRGVEPTCFRRVDALGALVPSDEPSVGRRLTFPPEHYPSGAGGIRNPNPLPAGSYEPVPPAALTEDLLARLALRYHTGLEALEASLGERPDPASVAAVLRIRLSAGIAAWERGDLPRVRTEAAALEALQTAHAAALPDAPDARVLSAVVAFADGRDDDGRTALRQVLSHYDGSEPLLYARSDAHAVAMWLALEHTATGMEDWNRRVVPLLNRYRDDPARITQLCTIGRRVLRDAEQTVESLVPECQRP